MLSWSSAGYRTTLMTLGVGSLAIAAMLSDLWGRVLPAWAVLAIALLPLVGFVFVHPGELPARVVLVAHVVASVWYLVVAAGLLFVWLSAQPLPRGWWLYPALVVIGAIPCGIVLYRAVRGKYHSAWHFDSGAAVPFAGTGAAPQVESGFRVIVTGEEIACEHPQRKRESIRWEEVVRISYVTTSAGPWLPDEWLLFEGKTGGCSVPTEAQGFERIWDVLKARFPGFDYRPMVLGGTDDARYLCWTNPGEPDAVDR